MDVLSGMYLFPLIQKVLLKVTIKNILKIFESDFLKFHMIELKDF